MSGPGDCANASPQGMYTGETMLGRSWWDLPVSAWRAVEEGAANGNLTTSGGWTVRTELGGVELPHLVGAAGASLAFNVPPRTTYLQLNGTATNTAARYSVSVSPDPLQGGPATSTISTRAWPHVVEYFGLPLDPGKEYAVTLTALEGDVGLQSVLFIGDDYTRRGEFTSTVPQGPNEGSAGGATTTSGDGSSGSSDGGSGTGRSGSGGSTGTTSDPETGSSADGGQGSKPNIGAIVGGVVSTITPSAEASSAVWLSWSPLPSPSGVCAGGRTNAAQSTRALRWTTRPPNPSHSTRSTRGGALRVRRCKDAH